MNKEGFTFEPFNQDVYNNAGYIYTTGARLSSQIANDRLSIAALSAVDIGQQHVIDIGCGDGTYTIDLLNRGHPRQIMGIDPAARAIEAACMKKASQEVFFQVGSAYALPFADSSFDVAHLRGVLHHLDHPQIAIREALRVASKIIILEPNGYNPALKIIERFSNYHREHEEKSYSARMIDAWVRDCGGNILLRRFVGLVPFFCPDTVARTLKYIEPFVERTPLIRCFSCGVYLQVARRK